MSGPLSQLPTMIFSDLLRGVFGERGFVLTVTIHVSFEMGGSHFQVSFTVTKKVMLLTPAACPEFPATGRITVQIDKRYKGWF